LILYWNQIQSRANETYQSKRNALTNLLVSFRASRNWKKYTGLSKTSTYSWVWLMRNLAKGEKMEPWSAAHWYASSVTHLLGQGLEIVFSTMSLTSHILLLRV